MPPLPELPEVETFKRFIDTYALHKPIRQAQVFRDKILSGGLTADALQQATQGQTFQRTLRRGKALFVELHANAWLLLHFGMTGYLSYWDAQQRIVNAYGDPARPHAHIRVQFDFMDDSHLAFHEQRLFGYTALVEDPALYIAQKKLGPDALAVDEAEFLHQLARRKGQIKPILMDQSFVAGIGNVYADEMLFQCRIHPERPVQELNAQDRADLFRQMAAILHNTVRVNSDRDQLPSEYLLHVRGAKGRCPRDGSLLEHKQVGGRTTYFCPICQAD